MTGPKVFVTGGSWTINGASTGRDHSVSGGTLTHNANLTSTERAVILSGTGTLNYNVASAVLASGATVSSGDNGFRITGGTLDNTSGAAINTNASTQTMTWEGNWTFSGTNGANSNLNLGTGAVFLKTANPQVTVSNAATTLTLGGVIQNDTTPGRGLTKAGAGTLRLSGTGSTYTGVTTITAGTLSVASIGNGGAAGSLGQATSAATNIVFNGGTLLYTGANATSDRAFTINTGITATIETANNISFAGATGAATTGALTKTGAGQLTLTNVNTYSGLTTVSAGTLLVNGSLGNSAVTVLSGATIGGTGSFAGNLSLDAGAKLGLTGATLGMTSSNILTAGGSSSITLTDFGFSSIDGWDWENAAEGTYTLIHGGSGVTLAGTTPTISNPFTFTNGNQGYFQSGSLQAVIIPEPTSALLGSLGLLLLLRRKRA